MPSDEKKSLRLVAGDQLDSNLSALRDCNKALDVVLMGELWVEATYVRHHKKKIGFLFSAMRHFAETLISEGYQVDYLKLGDPTITSFTHLVKRAIELHHPEQIVVTFPGEHRVLKEIETWECEFDIPVVILEDDRFMCSLEDFAQWAEGRIELRMEYFYREMRKKYSVLMDGRKPLQGKWNFDNQNRKPPIESLTPPPPVWFEPDSITLDVIQCVDEQFKDHFGDLEPFGFAVTREQAKEVFNRFLDERLPYFGEYQDAMLQGEPWMYHSHISFYLNCGLLSPHEVVEGAERAYLENKAPLNAVEGFIRQILGWREFIRGIYWLHMPEYAERNFFEVDRDLPAFYWTGNTRMNCLKQCISETRQYAYAHHIQRLMVLGNFALLAGIDPVQVNEWYMIVYADAYEWVELPNVSGMVLYADGGLVASKPYAAGGAYINRMSNYCTSCEYNVKEKQGDAACPFNYLYWYFLLRNKDKLEGNRRLSIPYRTLEKMDADKKEQIQQDAQRFLRTLG